MKDSSLMSAELFTGIFKSVTVCPVCVAHGSKEKFLKAKFSVDASR
jgi:hypothetical protein